MKIDFSKVIPTDESRVTFDGPDGLVQREILSNSGVLVAKKARKNR